MTMWTEARISRELDGRFYQLQQKSLGKFTVVDLNDTDEAEVVTEPAEETPELDRIKPRADGSFWLDDIGRVVCGVFEVSRIELKSPRRAVNLVAARQVFFWLAKRYTGNSYPFIGSWCGGRDHSTVMHGFKKVDQRIDKYRSKIEQCVSRLGVSLDQEAA